MGEPIKFMYTEKHKTNGDSSPIISVSNGDSSPIISVNNANNNNIMNNINVIPQVSNIALKQGRK